MVVVDARPVVADGLAAALRDHGLRAFGVSTRADTVAATAGGPCTVIVVSVDRAGAPPDLLRCALDSAPAGTGVVVIGPVASGAAAAAGWPVDALRAVLPPGCTTRQLVDAVRGRGPARLDPASVDGWSTDSGDRPRHAWDRLAALTSRERHVLALLAEGRSTREMAVLLSVSVNTVSTHVTAVLRKLDVHSRPRAVAVFAEATAQGEAAAGSRTDS